MNETELTQKMQKKPETHKLGNIVQLIVFHLGDEEFGANIDQVREIIWRASVTPIPDSPDFIKGVTNVRGEIAVVIDLKKRFFLRVKQEIEEKHIIMTEQDKNLFGLMVDEVTEVLRIPKTDIKGTPEFVTRIDRIYINGVLTLENRLIMLLDLEKVLSEEELAKLSEIRVRHRTAIEEDRESVASAESADTTAKKSKKRKRNIEN
ncbi:MAG: purine binding chemotaxis protein [Candidatus Scalindua rubra]|uniref:Purine binding chemotaxis protein n=1 Tax=Candidatus Scalindua rubra TaxID=1872076 RepID=A0A1E3X586_9BACT|nr:MAG: purine binding chemotaxis protein [Candidatus Scalindua rubra]